MPLASVSSTTPANIRPDLTEWSGAGIADRLQHLVLPSLVLILQGFAFYSRYQRNSMLDVLGSDFVRTAQAKGLRRSKALIKHALRTALIPMGTFFAYRVRTDLHRLDICGKDFQLARHGRMVCSVDSEKRCQRDSGHRHVRRHPCADRGISVRCGHGRARSAHPEELNEVQESRSIPEAASCREDVSAPPALAVLGLFLVRCSSYSHTLGRRSTNGNTTSSTFSLFSSPLRGALVRHHAKRFRYVRIDDERHAEVADHRLDRCSTLHRNRSDRGRRCGIFLRMDGPGHHRADRSPARASRLSDHCDSLPGLQGTPG